MSITFVALKDRIKRYMNKSSDFLTDELLADCIQMGQYRLWRELKDLGFEFIQQYNSLFTSGSPVITKPANWDSTISLSYKYQILPNEDRIQTMFPRNFEFCSNYCAPTIQEPNGSIPLFYCDHQENLRANTDPNISTGNNNAYTGIYVSPTPFKRYPYTLIYRQKPNLTPDDENNLLFVKFPDLLFYSCMIETLSAANNDSRLPSFKDMYEKSLMDTNSQNEKRVFSRSVKFDNDL
jgi:hypothetical protein